jgi:Ni/Co efflux regulator RcnB
MKAIFVFTVVAVFSLGVSVAFAADEHRDTQHGGNSQGQSRPQDQGRQQSQPRAQEQSRPQAQPRAQEQPRSEVQARPQRQPRSQAQVAPQRQQRNQPSRVMAAPANNAARGIASQNQARRSIGGVRTNVDIHAYQRNVSAPRHFQAGSYRAPQGYSYRRWSWGQRLPAIYFGRDYWISDYSSYGLFAPPYGLVWVRFGPDALLIDEYSGEIVQVDYGVFY